MNFYKFVDKYIYYILFIAILIWLMTGDFFEIDPLNGSISEHSGDENYGGPF